MPRQYKIDTCAVCGHHFDEQRDMLQCPKCRTRYDLVKCKVDISETMINPGSCKHPHRERLQSSEFSGDIRWGRNIVLLCPACGEFTVRGHENGVAYNVKFTLCLDEHLEAAGKWIRLLEAEEAGER